MLLIGYCFGIRSERRLCDEVHLNLAYRWFCRLGWRAPCPTTRPSPRTVMAASATATCCAACSRPCSPAAIAEGLVGGEGFAVDASLIKADANRQKGVEGTNGLPPETVSRAAREYLAVLDDAAFGAATPVAPKLVSPADPAARWTGADGGLAYFAYAANYLIDLDHAVIVDVEPTTAIRQAEVTAAKRMIVRSRERFDLYPARLAGDSGYGSAAMLGWLVHEQGIEPHIPVFDKSERRDGTFSDQPSPTTLALTPTPARPASTCGNVRRSTVTASARRRRRDAALPREQARLRCLRAEATMLPQRIRPQDPTLNPRGRPADGARHLRLGGGPYLAAGAQEGRDAVCPPQANPEAGSASVAGAGWSPGRNSTSRPPPRTYGCWPS